MKKYLLIVLLSMGLVGCNNDDMIEVKEITVKPITLEENIIEETILQEDVITENWN